MKTKLTLLALALFFCSTVFAQKDQERQQKYPEKNVVKMEKAIAIVNNFKAIDLSKFGYNMIAKERLDSVLKAAVETARATGSFDCNRPEDTKPLVLGKLNQYDDRMFDVTKTKNLNLRLFDIGGSLKKRDRLFQNNFWIFKDFHCPNARSTRAMIGMTLYITVKDLKIDLDEFTLKNLTMAAQLGKAKITYHIQFFGLNGVINFSDFNSTEILTQDNYTKIIDNWLKLKSSLNKNTIVDPVIIPNIIPVTPEI
ncbi:hypothetical protein [Pedobacter sp. Hv1]|uniref:hypothetical protein n=1 Tax=Pedobacter sp. Hv1 TaxID=1740090 RepID=UPI0006D8AD6A|nr:hypothetical protein [Pedobacter sp. Hv1]KQC00481.1 hypothetical protein AQF98_13485 [Pedobacter sp. Hv1]